MRLGKEPKELFLSSLDHTWIIDLDGTLVKHNGYKIDGEDSFLEGAKEFLSNIPAKDMVIILTSRTEEVRSQTEAFLRKHDVHYDMIIYNVPYGERILINDDKPSGLKTAIALAKVRDERMYLKTVIHEETAQRTNIYE